MTSIERSTGRRHNRVYVDFLQNRKGQTIATPYSIRPRPYAPVSTPLHWDELDLKLNPEEFNIKTIFKRLEKYGDIWRDLYGSMTDINKVLLKIEEVYKDFFKKL